MSAACLTVLCDFGTRVLSRTNECFSACPCIGHSKLRSPFAVAAVSIDLYAASLWIFVLDDHLAGKGVNGRSASLGGPASSSSSV